MAWEVSRFFSRRWGIQYWESLSIIHKLMSSQICRLYSRGQHQKNGWETPSQSHHDARVQRRTQSRPASHSDLCKGHARRDATQRGTAYSCLNQLRKDEVTWCLHQHNIHFCSTAIRWSLVLYGCSTTREFQNWIGTSAFVATLHRSVS